MHVARDTFQFLRVAFDLDDGRFNKVGRAWNNGGEGGKKAYTGNTIARNISF